VAYKYFVSFKVDKSAIHTLISKQSVTA